MAEISLWEVVPDKTSPTWLEVKDPDDWYYATVRDDGCLEFMRFFNLPLSFEDRDPDDVDQVHICEIDEWIRRLEALKAVAVKYFGDKWSSA